MKTRIFFLFGAILLLLTLLPLFRSRQTSLPWNREPAQAFREASERNQSVLVFVYTDWCTYCSQMDQTTFSDPEIIEQLGSQYVWLRLNAETDPEGIRMRREFSVEGFPTLLILDSRRREIDRLPGYLPPDRFLEEIRARVESASSFGKIVERAENNPGLVEAQYRLGEQYLRRNMFSEAEKQFSRIAQLDPTNTSGKTDASLFYLSESMLSLGKVERALTVLEDLEQRFPGSGYSEEADLLRAELYLNSGKRRKAATLLTRFVRENPDHRAASQIKQFLLSLGSSPVPASSH